MIHVKFGSRIRGITKRSIKISATMLVIPNAYAWGALMLQTPQSADQAAAIGRH